MVDKLLINKSYINSGNNFSRVFLVSSNFTEKKKIIIFDSEEELQNFQKTYEFITKQELINIVDNGSLLYFYFANSGIFITTKEIFESSLPPEYEINKNVIELKLGDIIKVEDLIKNITSHNYLYSLSLGEKGTYNKEGDIFNLRPFFGKTYFKISFFGNEIDDILEYNNTGARPINKLQKINIILNYNNDDLNLKKSSIENNQDKIANLFKNSLVFFVGLDFWQDFNLVLKNTREYIIFSEINKSQNEINLKIKEFNIDNLDEFKNLLLKEKNKINIYTKNIKTIKNFLDYNSISAPNIVETHGVNLGSFSAPNSVYVCDDILGNIFIKKRYKKKISKDMDLLLQIKPGDYVVHVNHGIGIFKQIIVKDLSGVKREYIEIEYKDNDKLFVPISEIYRVSKYIGSENPKLTNLNTEEWDKIIKNTEKEVEKIAKELIEIYAKRKIVKGFSFLEFNKKELEFKKAFPYKYTIDQERCIDEILQDMTNLKPMERLLTGDVGFGKTEVAMNAVYRAFLNGKQSAIISPLVVLAYDHFESFKKRFANFGLKVEVLTRISTQKEERVILKKLKSGEINCIIGTHRLLSFDIEFKNLGLLIIDEEHRFGVLDKEKLNKIKTNIDILSLSATPIPRSLNFALSGVKDISIISTPPPLKKPIETFVSKFDDELIKNVIKSELSRNGQILFIHNKISNIDNTKKYLEDLVGKQAKIIITHGQMNGIELEDRIMDFKNRKYNILLSTTVIENGVNFLDANTIIINEADKFGLSQLHQLRGRIARKDIKGYCYLIYSKEQLQDDAKKRLVTIANNSHLGAGFEIALRDLEIRGAGEVLGVEQSGKTKNVGLSLYFRLLEEKIEELKSGQFCKKIDCKIELNLSYYIPDEFFNSDIDKLHFFKNLESLETIEDLDYSYQTFVQSNDQVLEELENLFLVLKARIILREFGVISLKKVLNNYMFELDKNTSVEKVKEFLKLDKNQDFCLITIHKIKVDTKLWKNDKEFLKSLIDN